MQFIIAIFIFLFGIIIGSFLNVCIYRIPNHQSVNDGFSYCPTCHHRLYPIDLVPVFSYLFLKGHCRYCHTKISMRYPLIELLTGALFLWVYLAIGFTLQLVILLPLTAILVVITMIDLDTMTIPDGLHVAILILGLLGLFIQDLSIMERIIGFFIISVPFYLLAVLTNGMGGGDIKLMAVCGFLLGAQVIIVAAFIGILLGGFVGVFLLLNKKAQRKSEIPFGPTLCIGIFLASLYGMQIYQWYFSFFL